MEYIAILADILLLIAIIKGNLWARLSWLSMLAFLSAAETPVLFWSFHHLSHTDYFRLFYGVDLLTMALTLLSAIQIWGTRLRLISASMWILLVVDWMVWYFLVIGQNLYRRRMQDFESIANLVLVVIWEGIIFRYAAYERRTNGIS